jgi:phage terminase small subunit
MAAAAETKKTKPAVKKEAKRKTLPDGAVMDFSDLGLDDLKLTEKEKRYVFWYTNPDYETFQVKSKSAVSAGYKADSARIIACQLHGKPNVAEAIRRLMEPLKVDVKEEYERMIRRRIARIHYSVADYYKRIKVMEVNPDTKEPEEREYEVLKDITELTPEQLMAVDGVDYKGMAGRKVYVFADREKSMSEMQAIYNKLFGGPANDNSDDGESTMEIIRERLTVKMAVRKGKDEISQIAGFIQERGDGQLAHEL